MKVGARLMLFISSVNFLKLIFDGFFLGGKVRVDYSIKSIVFQLILILFLSFLSFRKYKDEP
jgi:hypothetical protein